METTIRDIIDFIVNVNLVEFMLDLKLSSIVAFGASFFIGYNIIPKTRAWYNNRKHYNRRQAIFVNDLEKDFNSTGRVYKTNVIKSDKLKNLAIRLYTKYSAQEISEMAWFSITTFHEIRRDGKKQPKTIRKLTKALLSAERILEDKYTNNSVVIEPIKRTPRFTTIWEKATEDEMSKLYILWQKLTTVMAQKDLANMLKISQSTASFVCNKKITRKDEVLMYIEKFEKIAKGYNLIK